MPLIGRERRFAEASGDGRGVRAGVAGSHLVLLGAVLIALSGCRTGTNYPSAQEPRYAGARADARSASMDTLRVVSFNIAYAARIDSALVLLGSESALQGADIILLQEMDERGTRRIAESLGMHFVYYPAVRSRRTGRDFGNAVLSAWPIVEDAKLILPHRARFRGTQRTATAATIELRGRRMRVYSTHLGTPVEIGPGARREQLAAVLRDAASWPHAIVGGDLNSRDIGRLAVAQGFEWPTRDGPRTTLFGRWDHIFLKGLRAVSAGTVLGSGAASDHHPVWALVLLP